MEPSTMMMLGNIGKSVFGIFAAMVKKHKLILMHLTLEQKNPCHEQRVRVTRDCVMNHCEFLLHLIHSSLL